MTTTFSRMFVRRGTAAQWAANNTVVLGAGELGVEIDTGRIKVGDGATQYGSLEYIGHDQGVIFATDAEVLAGTVTDKSVAPDTLSDNYPRRAGAAIASVINNAWTFNNQTDFAAIVTAALAPRGGAPGALDITNRAYIDGLFAGQTSGGSADVNKAPTLNSSGQLDTSFISSASLPSFRGTFNPTTGSPTLQNIAGGGISPIANNGDYFLASTTGFYNFDTGTPGAGTQVIQGAQVVWIDASTVWSVINPPGTSFDPGAVRKTPANNAESLIQPSVDAVVNLTLQNRTSQTVALLRLLDNLGGEIGNIGADAVATLASLVAEVVTTPATIGADYPEGLTHGYVASAGGWPIDGALTTLKNTDTDVYQALHDATDLYIRRFTGSWSAWTQMASQLFVTNAFANSPALGGSPTATTPATDNDSTAIATTAYTRLAVGDVLRTDGFSATRLSQVVSDGVDTVITGYTVEYNDGANFNIGPGTYDVPSNGRYLMFYGFSDCLVNGGGSFTRIRIVALFGAGGALTIFDSNGITGGVFSFVSSHEFEFDSGDTISLRVTMSTTGGNTTTMGTVRFGIRRLGDQ